MPDVEATAALVKRAQAGDAVAFTALTRMFLRAAFSLALAVVRRPADAEDVAQDAFVVALQRIGDCREPRRFAGWLMQIVRNRALNWLDSRRLRDVAANEDAGDDVGEEHVRPELVGVRDRLIEALEGVSDVQREVVLLHDLEEWTHGEIGEALGMSEGMSRQHLLHARKLLRVRLQADALEEQQS